MITPDFAARLVRRWEAEWDARDLEAVLAGYHDRVVFTSRYAATLVQDSDGVLSGKPALRVYWAAGLAALPHVRFTGDRT